LGVNQTVPMFYMGFRFHRTSTYLPHVDEHTQDGGNCVCFSHAAPFKSDTLLGSQTSVYIKLFFNYHHLDFVLEIYKFLIKSFYVPVFKLCVNYFGLVILILCLSYYLLENENLLSLIYFCKGSLFFPNVWHYFII